MIRLVFFAGIVLAVIPTTRPILFRTLSNVLHALMIPLLIVFAAGSRRR
jgi:hypothetical protein